MRRTVLALSLMLSACASHPLPPGGANTLVVFSPATMAVCTPLGKVQAKGQANDGVDTQINVDENVKQALRNQAHQLGGNTVYISQIYRIGNSGVRMTGIAYQCPTGGGLPRHGADSPLNEGG